MKMNGSIESPLSDYDVFARVYERHWGGFVWPAVATIQRMILGDIPPGARILDLCCGAGQLAGELSNLDYEVAGIDLSEQLLLLARRNAPEAKLVRADARAFGLARPVAAAVSMFDSLNHIMTIEELRAVFTNVYRVLDDGGPFLFDLNAEFKYRSHWSGTAALVDDDQVCAIRTSYEPSERLARFDATIFTQRDGWQRSDVTLWQRYYPEPQVRSALTDAGFQDIRTHDWWRDGEPNEETERICFIAYKQPVDTIS